MVAPGRQALEDASRPRRKPQRARRPGEIYIHWPGGWISKAYVALILFGVGSVLLAGLLGAPQPVRGQHKPWYEVYLSKEAQAAAGKRRWQMALDSLSPEEKFLVDTKRAFAVPTGDHYKPVELLPVDEDLAAELRAGRAFLVPQVTKAGAPRTYGVVYLDNPVTAASPTQ